mmetsp:Transcript_13760/g.23465  ORF Transcript_13760/g.23465 Transcript_13760/m.23465 type:complete len:139 (-) Transcript_13760:46-462(-)
MHYAYGGQQALMQVEAQSDLNAYQVIFMDCNMPFMDGYQATRRIRQLYQERGLPQPYIAAITGHGEEMYVEIAADAGMNQVIVKPASKKQIDAILAKVKREVAEEFNLVTESVEINEDDAEWKESRWLEKNIFLHFKD